MSRQLLWTKSQLGRRDSSSIQTAVDPTLPSASWQVDHIGGDIQGVPKKSTFRMLLELSRAASGKVTLSRNLAKVTLPEAALLSSNSILKVRFLGHPVHLNINQNQGVG